MVFVCTYVYESETEVDTEKHPIYKFQCIFCDHIWIEQTFDLLYNVNTWRTCIHCGSKFGYQKKEDDGKND